MMPRKDADEPREATQATNGDKHVVDDKSTEVKAEDAEKPTESWSDATADDEEMMRR